MKKLKSSGAIFLNKSLLCLMLQAFIFSGVIAAQNVLSASPGKTISYYLLILLTFSVLCSRDINNTLWNSLKNSSLICITNFIIIIISDIVNKNQDAIYATMGFVFYIILFVAPVFIINLMGYVMYRIVLNKD